MNQDREPIDQELAKGMSLKQKPSYRPWAQKRNLAKARLYGLRKQLETMSKEGYLTASEFQYLGLSLLHINRALLNWRSQNNASKLKFGKR
jgi:hypothetical protein